MTQKELDELKTLANDATPGPWKVGVYGNDENIYIAVTSSRAVLDTYVSLSHADAAFIAAAREAVPALIAEVERLRKIINKIPTSNIIILTETGVRP